MHARQPIPPPLLRLARTQEGVISANQCRELGFSRRVVARLLAEQRWIRLTTGIYRIRDLGSAWHGRAHAGLLLGGDHAVLWGRSAGFLWGIIREPPESIEVRIPAARQVRDRDYWTFTRTRAPLLGRGDPCRIPFAETVIDLCALEPSHIAVWIDRALHLRRGIAPHLRSALANRARVPHRGLISAMITDHESGIHSELERIYHRDVERAHGLPVGRRQVLREGVRTDVEYGYLIVELDGRLGHEGEARFRDMHRDNTHLLEGRLTLRFGWTDCTLRPCEVAQMVATVLRQLGIEVHFTLCPRCPR